MKCLAVGRQTLKRAKGCPGSFASEVVPSASSCRRYAFIPTPQRMRAHDKHGPMDDASSTAQAQPLSGYYSLLLTSPLPYSGVATTAQPTPAPATESQKPQTPQEKMAIVFGTRLAGPGRQSRYNPGETPPESMWKTINGVPIPPRPEEPDNCCMSGCVHCVWDDFRDEMEEWAARVAKATAKGGPERGTADMRTEPRAEVDSASMSMDDDGGGSESNWTSSNPEDDLFASIPVGIREFMKTEKKLRAKHRTKDIV